MSESPKDKKQEYRAIGIMLGALVVGAAGGAALGVALDNLMLWLALGTGICGGVGVALAMLALHETGDDSGNE